jgi:hypothetical protein
MQPAMWVSVTTHDEKFETPNFLDLHMQLSSNTSTHLVYTKVTLQEASSYIITSIPKVWSVKGFINVFLFVI